MSRRHKDTNEPDETRAVRRLRARLAESHQLHGLAEDPLLHAVRLERFRVSITRSMWFFLALGLGFTTTGVHEFLAGRLAPTDPMWWGSWLVEPGLAGILVTLLRWEAEMLSRGLAVDARPVLWLKRLLLGATLVTNVWAALRPAFGPVNTGMVFLHLVIPLVVFLIAEVMPVIQHRCNAAKDRALAAADPTTTPTSRPVPTSAAVPPASSAAPLAPRMPVKLPAHLQQQLAEKAAQVRAEDRTITPADVQDAVNVPDAYAARLAEQLNAATTATNGQPVAAQG
ncbi:hypothetical protein FHS29_005599 [Saccharothrix tamanrassetensis]|uniref:DUF2637 domain-containing protein n=1 Tax=Saccharothrix tamanrassetensis TaxID=1051531 RepID=A0A841CP85_9PSEU|nr:hypothetical protein [Saccharothrix tamanrassetensis]MBB5958990.1 hypothetical protein [Saccharothrix tamanrassetensis]